ncbi:unnamed protein product [Camellia sinensis]
MENNGHINFQFRSLISPNKHQNQNLPTLLIPMNLDGENSARFEENEGTKTSVDLERESGGAEEGELNRVEDGLNLRPLGGKEVFSGGRPAGGDGGMAAVVLG